MSVNGFDLTGKDMHDGLTGKSASDASLNAAELQAQSGRDAIAAQERFLKTIRKDLSPFVQFGKGQLPGLKNALTDLSQGMKGFDRKVSGLDQFINDPNAQLSYVQDNPFFSALADDAQNRLFSNQAAMGKLGSGDTASGLQNALLLLGNNLVQQSIGNRQQSLGNYQQGVGNRLNAVGARQNATIMGQNAAAQTGTMTQGSGNNISDLLTQIGNAGAAGQVGSANAQMQGMGNLASIAGTLGSIFLSDRRMKCDLQKLAEHPSGIPIYSFRYVGKPEIIIGVMAQDVEPVVPGAVLDVFGVKFVDYSELDRCLSIH